MGGQFPELRRRPTLDALQRLAQAGLMPQETADALARAYVFLRRVEHRIQYLDDQQTHVLPTRDDDLAWIARTMGYADCCAFLHELDAHRELVAQEFDTLLGGSGKKQCSKGGCGGPRAAAPPPPEMEALLEQLPPGFRERVAEWRNHPRVQGLRDETRARLFRLVQTGNVAPSEMIRAFNCGIGMIVVTAAKNVGDVERALIDAGEHPVRIGKVVAATGERLTTRGSLAL